MPPGAGLSPAAAAPVPDRGLSICLQILRCEPAGCHSGVSGEPSSGLGWELVGDEFCLPLPLQFQIVARGLIARGAPGAIVNISSQASQRAITNHSIYCE